MAEVLSGAYGGTVISLTVVHLLSILISSLPMTSILSLLTSRILLSVMDVLSTLAVTKAKDCLLPPATRVTPLTDVHIGCLYDS